MIKAIISDADGTLVNTVYLIRHGQYEAVAEYLMNHGIPKSEIPDYDTYEEYVNRSVGGPTRETIEKTLNLLFSKTHEHILNKINFEEIDSTLAPIQDHLAPLYVHPFHGLTELFSWLGKSKASFGIFTSGDRRMIMRNFGISLPALGYTDLYKADTIEVGERFQAFLARAKAVYGIAQFSVITCEDVTSYKPNPEGILKLLSGFSLQVDEVIIFGDHVVDMQAAQAAGIHAIGVSHGFSTAAELKEAGALRVIDDLASLPNIIENHNSGSSLLF